MEPDTAVLDADAREVVEVQAEGRPAPSTEPEAPDAPAELIKGELVRFTPTEHSLMPLRDELHGAAELAVTLAGSGLVPGPLRNKPADVLAVLLTGRELGVAPMTALRTFHVIDGRVTVAPKVRMAMVRQQGLGKLWPDPENSADVATWYAERTDQPGVRFQCTYTMAMAENAKLTSKDNWRHYPDRMLSWRACGYLLDDAFPEVGTGLYAPDEMGALTDEDGEPILDLSGAPLVSNQPKAPPDPEPNPREHAELVARIEAIKAHSPEAAAALIELWKGPDPEHWRLPKVEDLRHSQMRTATAAVEAIEKRMRAGEFPSVEQAAPDRPLDEPQTPAEPQPAPEVPDAPIDPATAPVAPEPSEPPYDPANPPADIVAALWLLLESVDGDELNELLAEHHLPATGNVKAKRTRLGNRLLQQGWLPPL